MYGLVNTAFQDFLKANHGSHDWDTIMPELPGYPVGGFQIFDPYDDSILFEMLSQAVAVTRLEPPEFLLGFGEHWILETSPTYFGALLTLAGRDIHEFMSNMNTLHERASGLFPGYNPPSFHVAGHLDQGNLEIFYGSEREGFELFVVGLLQGVLSRFKLQASIENRGTLENGEVVFAITASS